MSQELGTFTPPARMQGDQFRVDHAHGRPLLVRVHELLLQHTSQRFPTPKDKVVVDVVDLAGADNTGANPRVLIGVLWGADAVVDGLREQAGSGIVLPVIPAGRTSKAGNVYTVLEPMEGPALEWATAWYNANPSALDEARDRKMAEAKAAQAAGSPQAGPVQPQAPAVPQLQGLAAPAAQAPAPAAPVAQAAPAAQAETPPFAAPAAMAPVTSDQAQAALALLTQPAAS